MPWQTTKLSLVVIVLVIWMTSAQVQGQDAGESNTPVDGTYKHQYTRVVFNTKGINARLESTTQYCGVLHDGIPKLELQAYRWSKNW